MVDWVNVSLSSQCGKRRSEIWLFQCDGEGQLRCPALLRVLEQKDKSMAYAANRLP